MENTQKEPQAPVEAVKSSVVDSDRMNKDFTWLLNAVNDVKNYLNEHQDEKQLDAFSKDLLEAYHAAMVTAAKTLLIRINLAKIEETKDAPAQSAKLPIEEIVKNDANVTALLAVKSGDNVSFKLHGVSGCVHFKMKDAFPDFDPIQRSTAQTAICIDDDSEANVVISAKDTECTIQLVAKGNIIDCESVKVY